MTSTIKSRQPIWLLMGLLFRAHPWHGVKLGEKGSDVVTCYIEITPADTVKYELDKATGLLKLDRPQRFSNFCPALYGLLPQTYCGESVAALSAEKTGRDAIRGDQDPLDVCVLSERPVSHGDILLKAVPIGGLRMIDGDEADDKIVAVLVGDSAYGSFRDIKDCPEALVSRLIHYFETYKLVPGTNHNPCEITHVYGRDEAFEVIRRAQADYHEKFGSLESLLDAALQA
jgi:inorganic pyrophosphatase